MTNPYDSQYDQDGYYWGTAPSAMCRRLLEIRPPNRSMRLLDIGCGEGRNAVFLAKSGYIVSAFDSSARGIEKTEKLAKKTGTNVEVFQADINTFRSGKTFDILFSTGVLHYIRPPLRTTTIEHYKAITSDGGLHAFSVFVRKPFIELPPDAETSSHYWMTGELLSFYHDWHVEYCCEEVFDCNSSGVPHKHATNRVIATKPALACG